MSNSIQTTLIILARIPITFVLAFYMNHVVSRWWETWKLIPWPDSIALKLNTFLPNLPGKVSIKSLWKKFQQPK